MPSSFYQKKHRKKITSEPLATNGFEKPADDTLQVPTEEMARVHRQHTNVPRITGGKQIKERRRTS